MPRIFRVAVLLMGGLLLIVTSLISQARHNIDSPLRGMVICCRLSQHNENGLYLLEPTSGKIVGLTPFFYRVQWLGVHGNWIYFIGLVRGDSLGTIYRVQPGGTAQLVVEQALLLAPSLSPDGQWVVFNRPNAAGDHWYSVATSGGPVHDLLPGLHIPDALTIDNPQPIFTANSRSVLFQALDTADRLGVYQADLQTGVMQNLNLPSPHDAPVLVGYLAHPESIVVRNGFSLDIALFNLHTTQSTPLEVPPNALLSGQFWRLITRAVPMQNDIVLTTGPDFVQAHRRAEGRLLWWELAVSDWSPAPNGHWAVFSTFRDGWVVRNADGTFRRRLELPFLAVDALVWSHDTLYLVSEIDPTSLETQIWRVDMPDGLPTLIYRTHGGIYNVQGSPDENRLVLYEQSTHGTGLFWLRLDGSDFAQIVKDVRYGEHHFEGWGPTIDRPYHGKLLAVMGVLVCGVGILFTRIRKVV